MNNPPFADKTLLGTCMKLAHATFYEALPANRDARSPIAPSDLAPKRARQRNPLQRALTAIDNWFYRQRLASREAYLSQAANVFDLEARMRELERRPQY